MSVLYQHNYEKKKAIYRKAKKIHFQDPFYFGVMNGWISNTASFDTARRFLADAGNLGRLVEGIVANHLIRMAFMRSPKKQTFDYSGHVYYWQYDGGEVDLIYDDGRGIKIPVEVKFQSQINKRDLTE